MNQNDQSVNKSKYWLAVCYPENMVDGWQDDIDEILGGLPYAYCIHDADKNGDEEERKKHVHFFFAWDGPTTRKNALNVANLLSKPGTVCCPGVKVPNRVRWAYNYLIHDTDNARKKGKKQYPPESRIEGNGFDIGAYEQISQEDKDRMEAELLDYAVKMGIRDMSDFYVKMCKDFDWEYFEVWKSANARIDRVVRGNDNQRKRRQKPLEPPVCAFCGSKYVEGHYETEKGVYYFCGDERCMQAAYTVLEGIEKDD